MNLTQWLIARKHIEDAQKIITDGDYWDLISDAAQRAIIMLDVAIEALDTIKEEKKL